MRQVGVYVTIDVDDIFDSVNTDELVRELSARGERDDRFQAVQDALSMLRRGDIVGATTLLERTFEPKWANLDECRQAYLASRDADLPLVCGVVV